MLHPEEAIPGHRPDECPSICGQHDILDFPESFIRVIELQRSRETWLAGYKSALPVKAKSQIQRTIL
jgi:hypothetical protein